MAPSFFGRNYFYQMREIGKNILNAVIWCIAANMLLLPCRCSRPPEVSGTEISVFVSIPPQKYFVERIGGEYCRVQTLIPAGASPHTFEPKPRQMAGLAKARLFFSVGVEMEKVWLPRLQSIQPQLRIVSTDSGIVKLSMAEEGEPSHGEGDGDHDGHHHEGVDPHIWLSPDLVKVQAARIAKALEETDPQHAAQYRKRSALFIAEIDTLKQRIVGRLDSCGASKNFLVFHPSWGYFAHAFGLRQIAIEVEGKEPGLRQLGTIAGMAKREGIRAVLVQPQFSAKTAGEIARRIGGGTIVADPLAENWAENLERIAGVLCGQ
jgi:zinc transport system substrate-binding protein